jgi:hypothetical protein
MPTRKKAHKKTVHKKAPKKAAKRAAAKTAAAKTAVKKIASPARTAKKPPPPQPKKVAASCNEQCRVCGAACFRGGLHEQHRCRDHVGMQM